MNEFGSGQRTNRFVYVCPLSNKSRKMKPVEREKQEMSTDLKTGEQVYAVKSYSDHKNNQSLSFAEGDIITLLDQYPDGMCKGFVTRLGVESQTGFFPATCVVPFIKHKRLNAKMPIKANPNPKLNSKSFVSTVANRDIERNSSLKLIPDISHMYSCDYNDIRYRYVAEELPMNSDPGNRSSSISVDSGRGSAIATMMNFRKLPTENTPQLICPTQNISESSTSQSIESGLASYQHQSSSSNSSISGGSSIDGSNNSLVKRAAFGSIEAIHENMFIVNAEEDSNQENIIKTWLKKLNLDCYINNFLKAGYDFCTLLKMTPEDLNAVGVTNPSHRKIIKNDINSLIGSVRDNIPDTLPESVEEWLSFLNLSPYVEMILGQGYDSVEKLADLTWEDLEEIGIKRLGHQKKLMIAVERLKKIRRNIHCDRISTEMKAMVPISEVSYVFPMPYECVSSNFQLSEAMMKPIPPLRQTSHLSATTPISSPFHEMKTSLTEVQFPPPTPKRTSSISPLQLSNRIASMESKNRQAYVNITDSIEEIIETYKQDSQHELDNQYPSKSMTKPLSPKSGRCRSSSIMNIEMNALPFANENCGTIKQRSSSLGRNEALREDLENGVTSLKNLISLTGKTALPLSLPYNIQSDSYRPISSSEKLKMNLTTEKNVQIIPTDVHVAIREKVPLPKLHLEDNSSNEDFNEICDMLEDLTEMLDKDVS